MSYRVLALVALTLSSLAAGPAAAQESELDERARLHFHAGRSYFDEGQYEGALQEFERAMELSGRDELHYNLYLCHERLGHLAQAITHLEAFLETSDPPNAELLRTRLQSLLERQARNEEEARQRAAQEALDDGDDEAAGDAQVGAPATVEEGGVPIGALVGYGVAGAGLITFGVAGGLGLASEGDLSEGCVSSRACSQDDVDATETRYLVADIGLAVGVAGAITGVVLHVIGNGDDESAGDDTEVSVAPMLGRERAGLALTGSF